MTLIEYRPHLLKEGVLTHEFHNKQQFESLPYIKRFTDDFKFKRFFLTNSEDEKVFVFAYYGKDRNLCVGEITGHQGHVLSKILDIMFITLLIEK